MTTTRRAVLTAGVAGVAAAGGWLWQRDRVGGAVLDEGALWQLKVPRPGGGELDMAGLRGQPLLVNFWATWCAPCIKELPEIERFAQAVKPRQWRVAALAVDTQAAVESFLKRVPLPTLEIGIAGFEGSELARQLGDRNGLLPFTVLFDAAGRLRKSKLGETNFIELQTWADSLP